MNHMNAETLIAVLRDIANARANSNSEPDDMGEELDRVVALASDAVRNYTHDVQAGIVSGVFEVKVPGCDWPVQVRQIGRTFTVTYGSEVRDGMTYETAGDHFGHAIFHALVCAGVVTDCDEER